jgi:hypothetical protein
MIRIDEIYNNTFWPYILKKYFGTRMFFCDPFGHSDPDSIKNYGTDNITELQYIFFFDQEPIHLSIHLPTFDKIRNYCNPDIHYQAEHFRPEAELGYLVTSEKNSENVEYVCNKYNWKPLYYFFHGWASLDWYRGYDKTFLIVPPEERTISKTFIAPNRIVAGQRQHRLLMLYHIFKLGLTDNWISCPEVCPVENIAVSEAIKPLKKIYNDIDDVFAKQTLPIDFPNEKDSPMHSCWLSLFDECAETLLYLVTETVATGKRWHLTEKTFKPICMGMPFILVSTVGSLEYLRSYGFKTFDSLWDESYDLETDDVVRIEKIAKLLERLDSLPAVQKQALFEEAMPIIMHNKNHFYNGGFEKILWDEANTMLDSISVE